MQLPRLIIGAVFFVIAALLAIPMLIDQVSPDSNVSTAATTPASPDPSGAENSPSPDPSTPPQPVTASIGSVNCPASKVNVTIRNSGNENENFRIEKNDDSAAIPGEIRANGPPRTVAVDVEEGRNTRITVNSGNQAIETKTVQANCEQSGAAPTPPGELPSTGPDTVLWARGATGVAILLMGGIIFWYGGIWPRRRDDMFSNRTR